MKPCEWILYKRQDGKTGCIPATNATKYFMKDSMVKSLLCSEAEAIAECRRIDAEKEVKNRDEQTCAGD